MWEVIMVCYFFIQKSGNYLAVVLTRLAMELGTEVSLFLMDRNATLAETMNFLIKCMTAIGVEQLQYSKSIFNF